MRYCLLRQIYQRYSDPLKFSSMFGNSLKPLISEQSSWAYSDYSNVYQLLNSNFPWTYLFQTSRAKQGAYERLLKGKKNPSKWSNEMK